MSVEKSILCSFIGFRLKRAQKKSIKQTKNALFHARSGNGPLAKKYLREGNWLVYCIRIMRLVKKR